VHAAAETPAQLIERHGTVLDAYHRESGVWVTHAPALVNEDFDFAIAMGLEGGMGAGLAAAKRKENNQKRAAALVDLRLPADVELQLTQLRCRGMHVYFVLWGGDNAALTLVLDVEGDVAQSRVVDGGKPGSGADQIVNAVRGVMTREFGPARE
jgi:hypothetical protein